MHPLRLKIGSSALTSENLSDAERIALREPDVTIEVAQDGIWLKGADEQRIHSVAIELRKQLGENVEIGGLSIDYLETVTRSIEVEGKIKPSPQGYAHVWIRVGRGEEGKGVTFLNRTVPEVVPGLFIPAVEAGVREALKTGSVAGYPMTDIEVSLFDGSYHAIDSTEDAFKRAAIDACRTALAKCDPVLLEPIMFVEVTTPAENVGNVAGDISSRGGLIAGMDDVPSGMLFRAQVPLAHMLGYGTDLAKLTSGKGVSSMKFSHYAKAPPPEDPDDDEPASMAMKVA